MFKSRVGGSLAFVAVACFALAVTPVTAVAVASGSTPAPFGWTFDTDAQGWQVYAAPDYQAVTHVDTGGNPGGYLEWADPNQTGPEYFTSPYPVPDLSKYIGGAISVDLRTDGPQDLQGSALTLPFPIHAHLLSPLATVTSSWATYRVPLNSHAWCAGVNGQSCSGVSASDFRSMLASVTQIWVRADYQSATTEHTDMDNLIVTGPSRVERTLTLRYAKATSALKGKLTASDKPCVASQTVRVFKRRPGKDHRIGKVPTTTSGAYTLPHARTKGTFYSVVTEQLLPNAGELCLAARSPKLHLE